MLRSIDPGFAVEAGGVDDKRVSVVLAKRCSHPTWFNILGALTSVCWHHVKDIIRFPQYRQPLGGLNDLHGIFSLPSPCVTPRLAISGVVESIIVLPLR